MADHDLPPDDPFLERRLTTLSLLPVPERPRVDDLTRRGPAGLDLDPGSEPGDGGRRQSHRTWMLTGAAAAAVVLALIAVAAVVRTPDSGLASGTGASLAGRTFVSVTVSEGGVPRTVPIDVPEQMPVTVTLTFAADGESLRASAGCNELDARFTIDGAALLIERVTRTAGMCPGPYGGVDEWLTAILVSSPTIALDGDRLTLTSGDTVIELLDREVAEPDLPLVGTPWELRTVVEDEVSASAQPLGASIPFSPRPDGSTLDYVGNDGCRDFGGSLRRKGDDVDMVEWHREDGTCPAGDHRAVFFEVLRPGLNLAIAGSQLTISNGNRALVFRGGETTVGPTPTTALVDRAPITGPATSPAGSTPELRSGG